MSESKGNKKKGVSFQGEGKEEVKPKVNVGPGDKPVMTPEEKKAQRDAANAAKAAKKAAAAAKKKQQAEDPAGAADQKQDG